MKRGYRSPWFLLHNAFPSFWEGALRQPQYPHSQQRKTYSILWLCLLQCPRHINFAPTIKVCPLAVIKETNNARETQTLRPNSSFRALRRWFRPNICQYRRGPLRSFATCMCAGNMAEGEKVACPDDLAELLSRMCGICSRELACCDGPKPRSKGQGFFKNIGGGDSRLLSVCVSAARPPPPPEFFFFPFSGWTLPPSRMSDVATHS